MTYLTNIKVNFKFIVIKVVWQKHKKRAMECDKGPETNSCIYENLV